MNDLLVFSIAEYEKIFKDIGAEDLVEQKGTLYIYGKDNKKIATK